MSTNMEDRSRKRAWKPKVKTGCATCKVRRIKCDEARPACRRCVSSGRVCDGYESSAAALISISRRSAMLHGLPPNLHRGTDKERESLNFFYGQTVPELAGFFESSFWQRDLPQAATHHGALRNAVVGLGALHRKFVDVGKHALPGNLSDKETTFALEYCNRAIQDIIKVQDSVDVVMTMTFCVIFHCFAWLQGHMPIALSHLRGGLKILQEIDAGKIQLKQSRLHPISFESLRKIFLNLDMQVRAMMNQDQLPFWEPKPKASPYSAPAHFTTFEEARSFIEEAFNEICSFLQLMDMGPKMELEVTREEIKRLTGLYERGDQLLTDFLAQPERELDQVQYKSLQILNMCRQQVDIFIRVFCNNKKTTELVWDTVEEEFNHIVTTARRILEGRRMSSSPEIYSQDDGSTPPSSPPRDVSMSVDPHPVPLERQRPHLRGITVESRKDRERPVLTFSMGIVSTLWTVAFRCRNPNIRRDAIQLLLDHPRREGFWDGTMAAKIAIEVLNMEEQACLDDPTITAGDPFWTVESADDIPDHHRISSVAINYTGLRSAQIKYTTLTDRKRRAAGVMKPLFW